MRFLVDGDLPRQTAHLIKRFGHEAIDVRDVGLGAASDREIASYAKRERLCLMTGDFGFADIRAYPPADFEGIVVFQIRKNFTATAILRMVETFLQQDQLLDLLKGRLAIVEQTRVRLRPR